MKEFLKKHWKKIVLIIAVAAVIIYGGLREHHYKVSANYTDSLRADYERVCGELDNAIGRVGELEGNIQAIERENTELGIALANSQRIVGDLRGELDRLGRAINASLDLTRQLKEENNRLGKAIERIGIISEQSESNNPGE